MRNLEYGLARNQLEAWLSQHPRDLRALNYLASTYLQEEMFRQELLESRVYASGGEAFREDKPAVSAAFRQNLFDVLNKAESFALERLRENPRDEMALYWIGYTHVTRAIYHLTVAKSHRAALGDAKEARTYHAELLGLNPAFVDAMLVVGIYDYIVGSLPWYLKFVAAITGHHGDKQRGLASIERVTREGRLARDDARQFLAILYYREKRYPEALAILEDLSRAYPRNFVIPQEIARTYKAQGNWRLAAGTYDQILARHRSGQAGYRTIPLTKILFQAGQAHAELGEMDRALELYREAASGADDNIFVYRAELAAGGVYEQQNRFEDARRRYERVAKDVPATDEGKAARQYLKQLPARQPAGRTHGS